MKTFPVLTVSLLACLQVTLAQEIQWEYSYGAGSAAALQQTTDGGYIVVGDEDVVGLFLLKIDKDGIEQWYRTLARRFWVASSVRQTTDGGFILAGSMHTEPFDLWLMKADENGNEEWSRMFALQPRSIESTYLQMTSDGGYMIVGGSGQGVFLIKTNVNGMEEWSRMFAIDWSQSSGFSGHETIDGGYIIAGSQYVPREGGGRNASIFLVKTDSLGNELWFRRFGGVCGNAEGYSVQQTSDGGYIIAGSSTECPAGVGSDVYLIKTDGEGHEEWSRTFGDTYVDRGYAVQQANDGGYILVGVRDCCVHADLYAIKTDRMGTQEWTLIVGGEYRDWAKSVQATRDGGYIIAGISNLGLFAIGNAYVIKIAPESNRMSFKRGDTNGDGDHQISDAVCLLAYLFGRPTDPCEETVARCLDAADANDDAQVNIADAIMILVHLFLEAPPLPYPFEECGYDRTFDRVSCISHGFCSP
jgi:hypothetical protein